jgi:hypothetical protein
MGESGQPADHCTPLITFGFFPILPGGAMPPGERYNKIRTGCLAFRGDQGRFAMEVILTGTEIHVLRGILETDIMNLEKGASGAESPKALGELKEKVKVLKSIAEKLPVELATV